MILNLSIFQKKIAIIKIICIAWFVAKIISYNTWISIRKFPVISVFDFLSEIPNSIHLSLYILSLIGILGIFIFPINKKVLIPFLIIEFLSCSLDQMRWQPWEYQYILTFIFLLISKDSKHFIKWTSLLLIATYFYSGIHKFNGGFLTFTWENMILKRMFTISKEYIQNNLWLHYLGIVMALIEFISGLGLIFLKNKKPIVISIIVMHFFILILLGPFSNHNHVVWPWNIAMMFLVYQLFYNNDKTSFNFTFFRKPLNIAIFILLFIMPVLSKFGYWYKNFSFNLYSGNLNKLTLCIKDFETYDELEKFKKEKTNSHCQEYQQIDVSNWAMNELNVPLNSDKFTYLQLKKAWHKKYPDVSVHFFISKYPYKNKNIIEIR